MPDGAVVVDPSGRLAGRGAYVCDDPACIAKALTKGALGRALSTPLPQELREALTAGVPNPDITIEGGARGQK